MQIHSSSKNIHSFTMSPIHRCNSSAFLINFIIFCASVSLGLKCRTDEGPSDEDMKRITRSCMRKISENGGRYNQNQSDDNSSYGNYDNNNNNNWDYEEYNRDERFRQGNRDRLQMRGRSKRSGNDRKYDMSSNGNRDRERNGNQNQRSNGNNNSNGNYNNHHGRNNMGMGNSNNNNSSYGDRHSRDMQRDQDGACVVHCFFEELNVLNNDDYPDKHKFTYILTKDIRDRELRAFYTDTIQECFHYVGTQRRKDKCQFSREIIHCMTEYAKSNCDDWQDHSLIFT
uniref:OBP1 n=1 Tax=Eupeodes corollae TaxID=290404 RepID=A0A8F9S0P8_9MUSC|nr:OBP1 [Eupeodes corollae]